MMFLEWLRLLQDNNPKCGRWSITRKKRSFVWKLWQRERHKIQKKIRENAIEEAKERTIYRNASYRPSQLRILVIAYYLHATCVSIYLTREISKEGSLMTSPRETRVSTIDYLLPWHMNTCRRGGTTTGERDNFRPEVLRDFSTLQHLSYILYAIYTFIIIEEINSSRYYFSSYSLVFI